MKATFISRENDIVKFTIELTKDELEKEIIAVYQANKSKYPVDGFRKGKAPRKLIERMYGEDVFKQDAINNLLQVNYPEALDQLALSPIGMPVINMGNENEDGALVLDVNVEVYPEVEVKDYKGVSVKKVSTRITEKDITAEIDNILKRNARMNIVDREAKAGDTVLIDYAGFDGDVQFEGGTAERFPLVLGSDTFIPGFEDQLIGVKSGEERDVNVTFPEDYQAAELAGHAVVFKCKVHEVKEEEIPVFDDEFVKDVSEFDTVDEYKASVKEDLKKAAKVRAENTMKDEAVKAVVDANEIDVPAIMVQDEIEARLDEIDQQLQYQGLNLDTYLTYMQKTVDEIKEEMKEDAQLAVKTKMVLTAVADQENLDVTEEELSAEVDRVANQYGMEADKMRELLGVQRMTMIGRDLRLRKAIDFIYDNAEVK